ncbi:MAG: hypothetical protein IKV32_01860 [Muribaculaceae bacterium]|nr:hypothetical protein [Muribaculaceae bacterium]
MDYETEILLNKFIEFIADPAWWGVILSAISTVAVIVIAVVQIKLQKRQTKVQEYDVNSKLYKLIKDVDFQIDLFIFRVFTYYIPERNSIKEPFSKEILEISELFDEFNKNYADLELKYPSEKSTLEEYRNVLIYMVTTLKLFYMIVSIEKKNNQDVTIDDSLSVECLLNGEKKQMETLLSIIPNDFYKPLATEQINSFMKRKTKLMKRKFVDKIAERCNLN